MRNEDSTKPARNKGELIVSRIISIPMLILTVLCSVCLFLAAAVGHIPPEKWMIPSYLGLGFPFLVLAELCCLLYWCIKIHYKWIALFPLFVLLCCSNSILKTIGIHGSSTPSDSTAELKILSYNVRMFNCYKKGEDILKYIDKKDADIVCLQEFGYYIGEDKEHMKREDVVGVLERKYPYYHICQEKKKWGVTYGVATFSKIPLSRRNVINSQSEENYLSSDVLFNGKKIRIYNLHLESNRLTSNDKEMVKELISLQEDSLQDNVERIETKLSDAYKKRAKQARIIAEEVSDCPIPVVVCGDFNDVPVSYTYCQVLGDKLKDSFRDCYAGYGHTFNEKLFPFRIDYILHSKELNANSLCIDHTEISDHYPLLVKLSVSDD